MGVETVIDEICEKLGIERTEFRMLNAAKEGTRRVDGVINGKIGMIETVEAVQNHPHYSAPLGESDGKLRGRGVAFGFCATTPAPPTSSPESCPTAGSP